LIQLRISDDRIVLIVQVFIDEQLYHDKADVVMFHFYWKQEEVTKTGDEVRERAKTLSQSCIANHTN
jgi:hypothetical protein